MNLKETLYVIKKSWWFISSVVLIACVLTGWFSYSNTTPVYKASTKLLINNVSQDKDAGVVNVNSITTNIMLMNSYKEIILSEAILNKVAQAFPDLKLTGKQLGDYVSASSTENSQIMTITAINEKYKTAVEISNAVASTFKQEIPRIMNVDNVTILTPADPNDPPVNISANPLLNVILAFLLSAMLSLGVVLLRNYLDDTLKTESDVEETLGIPTLSAVQFIRRKDITSKNKRTDSPSKPSQKVGEQVYVTTNQ